eukprot:g33731.t1
MSRNFFSQWVIDLRNSLPQRAVEAKSLSVFRTEIARFLISQRIKGYGEKLARVGLVRVKFQWCTADTISPALHSSLEHLDNKNTSIRLLLINYTSAFNTNISSRLTLKLQDLGPGSVLYNWILSLLTYRPQSAK